MKSIILDVQHMGKPNNSKDRGACCEISGIKLVEADLCLEYATIAAKALKSSDFYAHVLNFGSYKNRAEFADTANADLYLACHLNSFNPPPKTNYALIEITTLAGKTTKNFADHLAETFQNKLPIEKTKILTIRSTDRGWGCIGHVKAPALLLEPCFINHPASFELLIKKLWLIADAIVYSIRTFNWE